MPMRDASLPGPSTRQLTGTPVSWMRHAFGSLATHVAFTLIYHIYNFRQHDRIGRLCFFLYTAILAIYAVILISLQKFGQQQYLFALNACARIATLICAGVALPYWTVESGSCVPDFLRYLLLQTGVLALIFNTLLLPLPGCWQLPVHAITTAVMVNWNSSRVCSTILNHPSPCQYREQFSAVWPSMYSVARTLSGLLYAYIDEEKINQLDIHGQCQVSVVWIQVSCNVPGACVQCFHLQAAGC